MLFRSLFSWSKGATTRRKILFVFSEQEKQTKPVYISVITKIFNEKLCSDEGSVTPSCVRKHIHILKKFNLIQPINEGGRPEYLELTENGQLILNKLKKDYGT